MSPKGLRIGTALALFAFLFLFFVPLVYDATMFQCTNRSGLCLGDPSGLKSLGYTLFHWGGAYSFGGAGDPQISGYTFLPDGYFVLPDGSRLTASGVLLFIAYPILVVGVGLLGPEMVRTSRVTRAGFTVFGALDLTISAIFVSMVISGFGFDRAFALLGAVLGPTGAVMVLYGLGWYGFLP